ncbi:HNH endonuclease [Halarcobacter sp.]|uniref:HNH endonuclease n=1 Tax=Halarcobacter sp. TaxID=2321133 RepID=UPI003B00EAD3
MTLDELFSKVSKTTFIKYLELFENEKLENKEIISQIEEDWTDKSKNSRVSKAKKIINEFGLKEALINVLHSKKLSDETIKKARKKLNDISSQSDLNIPNGITKEMIIKAAEIYDKNLEIHYFEKSTTFDVIINDKLYPPKAIIGLASKFLTRVLHPSEFSAGHDKKCFKTLKDNGFTIIKKQNNINDIFNDNEVDEEYKEGKSISVQVNKYERDINARKKCIEHFGTKCQICNFDFEKVYGELGKDFIHVHHKKPISEIGKEYIVDPIKDLIPVCPNCHAMLHRRKPAYTINELRKKINY